MSRGSQYPTRNDTSIRLVTRLTLPANVVDLPCHVALSYTIDTPKIPALVPPAYMVVEFRGREGPTPWRAPDRDDAERGTAVPCRAGREILARWLNNYMHDTTKHAQRTRTRAENRVDRTTQTQGNTGRNPWVAPAALRVPGGRETWRANPEEGSIVRSEGAPEDTGASRPREAGVEGRTSCRKWEVA